MRYRSRLRACACSRQAPRRAPPNIDASTSAPPRPCAAWAAIGRAAFVLRICEARRHRARRLPTRRSVVVLSVLPARTLEDGGRARSWKDSHVELGNWGALPPLPVLRAPRSLFCGRHRTRRRPTRRSVAVALYALYARTRTPPEASNAGISRGAPRLLCSPRTRPDTESTLDPRAAAAAHLRRVPRPTNSAVPRRTSKRSAHPSSRECLCAPAASPPNPTPKAQPEAQSSKLKALNLALGPCALAPAPSAAIHIPLRPSTTRPCRRCAPPLRAFALGRTGSPLNAALSARPCSPSR
ncbi:hypothetical protein B0H17DRAFT_1221132 [Mycena rosella]|uniref:Uncharacterized protein n=1 Tax=Mycena rosella TaxID=1033263 RepID=A0AAD7B5P4_MYCRO|nr:hypothetical protein B0H17DRAFT_1221132 [Mycena rosella]